MKTSMRTHEVQFRHDHTCTDRGCSRDAGALQAAAELAAARVPTINRDGDDNDY